VTSPLNSAPRVALLCGLVDAAGDGAQPPRNCLRIGLAHVQWGPTRPSITQVLTLRRQAGTGGVG